MIVLFWSRATRDLLKSFGWGIAALHRLMQRRSCHFLAARPIASSGPSLGSAIDPIEGLVDHGLVPGAVPCPDIGLDLLEEVRVRPLLRGEALGSAPAAQG